MARKTRKQPIPFKVYERSANTTGGNAWVFDLWPNEEGIGHYCEFKSWPMAAAFIMGLNKGKVDQRCFKGADFVR